MTGPGGYRTPSTPAPVSGPGALSQRTDGGQPVRDLPDAKYGENAAFVAQQQQAPLATSDSAAETPATPLPPASGPASSPLPDLTPLSAPSTRPGEPVTAGSPLGPGPGPAAPGINAAPGSLTAALTPWLAADDTGVLANLVWNLSERGL